MSNTFSQYNLPAPNLQLRYPYAREEVRNRFREPAINRNLDIDLNVIAFYTKELASVEHFIEQSAKQHNPHDYQLLQTVPGIGRILALTILYEIGNIQRFPTVQHFASYSRLIKCKAESAGKQYGTSGNKIGNAHLKWAFSEAAVLYLRGNEKAKKYLTRLQKRMSKAKALSALAHKLGRCVYFMLRNKTVFDERRFLPE
ncbi:Transposase IS116/IS110/IS902 family protein [Enterovibrio nigricans DSM 22720]|uniref:Transposase IS116/IS110/IS902 family protein n=1 Tax=Enterovibrio nigricans DSM 22720 TaxID=1121868 RepID=A0A1T4WEF5_9GAMM|nr:Transposase IS116/IS110/IS902 family protein [Enterovibrio nigricans DSM 22720]